MGAWNIDSKNSERAKTAWNVANNKRKENERVAMNKIAEARKNGTFKPTTPKKGWLG
jgi:hypothetical protein